MKIHVKDSTMIRPAKETPKHCLPISGLDLVVPRKHVPLVYFYRRPNDHSFNFFEAGLLKEALSNVLVSFYPMAGRLGKDENGRIKIKCNAEGVLFLEAETSYVIDEFTDSESDSKLLQFVPTVDSTKDISSYPLLLIQVTHFKFGGVCIGINVHHMLVDATSAFHFVNSWAEMVRGLPISMPPSFDRTVLEVGVPISPTFHHTEYDPLPSTNTPTQNIEFLSNPQSKISTTILKLSVDQINILKEKSKKEHGSTTKYSKFAIIAAHIWRCMCKARGLSDDQASKLYVATSGRSMLKPEIPTGYIGNVLFSTAPMALSGHIQKEPLSCSVERIHKALKRMNDAYLKSSLAYLRQQSDAITALMGEAHKLKGTPNLLISNLERMPIHDANFGWGCPAYMMPLIDDFDGLVFILPSTTNDGGLSINIGLETHHMQVFKKFFYEIFLEHQNVRSRY